MLATNLFSNPSITYLPEEQVRQLGMEKVEFESSFLSVRDVVRTITKYVMCEAYAYTGA